jgi:hypothetical protein
VKEKMKKIWIGIGIAVILALLNGCGGGGTSGGTSGGTGGGTTTISGKVVDASDTTKGVEGATVALYTPSKSRQSAPVASTTTKKDGTFSLTTTAGRYTLHVELKGSYYALDLNIVASGTVSIEIRLVPTTIQKITRVEITGPDGPYYVGNTYTFSAKAYGENNEDLKLTPNWYVEGDIGTINQDGEFKATKAGSGKIWAVFAQEIQPVASKDITVTQVLTPEQVQRCFPLDVGHSWVYSNTKEQRFDCSALGVSHYVTKVRTDTVTIPNTYSGPPFPQGLVLTIRQHNGEGQETIDGITGPNYLNKKEFWTNQSGELKLWGQQEKTQTGTWGAIEAFPQPALGLKANATSWAVGQIGDEIDIPPYFGFQGDATATLSTETITVPAGTYNCYKVTFTFSNLQFHTDDHTLLLQQIKTFNGKFEIWVAENVGVVKWSEHYDGSGDFKDPNTGKTGTATFSSDQVWVLSL